MSQLRSDLLTALQRAVRLFFFKHPKPVTPAPGLPAIGILIGVAFLIGVGVEFYIAESKFTFNAYGVSSWLAGWALTIIAIVVLGTRSDTSGLARVVADLCMVGIIFYCVTGVCFLTSRLLPNTTVFDSVGLQDLIFSAGVICVFLWGIAVTVFTGRVHWKGLRRFPGLKLLVVTLLPVLFIPYQPVVYGTKTDWSRYDVWELWKDYNETKRLFEEAKSNESYQSPFDYEAAIYRQRDLVERVLSGIKPATAGDDPNIYLIAAAPYAPQDVFKREVTAVKDLFDDRFGTANRSAMLINHHDTAVTLPMANATNLESMLNGISRSMNVDRDVLVLFLTTHGSKGMLSVSFPGFTFNDLTPDALATMLDNAQIKNRVLIISACHSGSFMPRLKNEDTIIMAAAHAEKTSFGCSNEREWTYFGDALFNQSLRKTYSLELAFEQADRLIKTWERNEKLTPSEPQIFVGKRMGEKWKKIAANLRSKDARSMPGTLSRRASRHLLEASKSMRRAPSISSAVLSQAAKSTN